MKTFGDPLRQLAEKRAKKRPDGSEAFVHSYLTATAFQRDVARLAADGWRVESTTPSGPDMMVASFVRTVTGPKAPDGPSAPPPRR